jgi:hypothetical protein
MATEWHLSGDYFENCNCSVVCPCLVSTKPQLTSKPTEGVCDVAMVFHIDSGNYGDVRLDGLNVALAVHTPGPMADGNWTAAAYVDERANDQQTEALGAIFTGAAGGPMAAFAPFIATNLGAKKVPIKYNVDDGEVGAATGHPGNPDNLAFAVGMQGSTFTDHGMRWDNSGRNGHYASINWSGQH